MEPRERNGSEKNTTDLPDKDTNEIASDDPTDESKGSSNEGNKEPETNQINFSLSNLRQSKKLTLLDSANTKNENDQKPNDSKAGFGFAERLGHEYTDALQNAADFFGIQNPEDSKIRCTSDYVEPAWSTTLKNRYSTPSNTVSLLTRTMLGALATAKKVAEGATVAEAVAASVMTPEIITIGVITAGVVAIPEILGVMEQRNVDLKAARNQEHIRCRELY